MNDMGQQHLTRKTHTTAVVIIPPKTCWPSIQTIRRQHDRQIRRWMPHITMIYPFRPHNEFESVVEQFQESCNMIAPFYITLSEFRFFHHLRENYTIWLAPMPKEPIMQLQTKLWELVPDCDDVRKHKNEFTPHLSVGQIRGHTNMRHVRDSLQAQWQPLTFSVQEISLIWRGHPPNDVFQIGKTIRLSSSRL